MEKRSNSKFRQTTTGAQLRRKREAGAEDRGNQRFFSRDFDHYQTQTRTRHFRRARSTEWDEEGLDVGNVQSKKNEKSVNHGSYSKDNKNHDELHTDFHMGTARRPAMKTLDKKISVSTDQLDTLTSDQRQEKFLQLKSGFPIRPRASYRFPTRDSDLSDGDVVFKYKGANYSKNEYFFGNTNTTRRSDHKYSSDYLSVDDQAKKTPFQMFLEDDGPYSRKLYGPLKSREGERENQPNDKLIIKNFVNKSRDYLSLDEEEQCGDAKQSVKKDLLWHQRDKLFSRWKERFFILTKDYFHCFKKDSSKLTEMGEFLFKVKLVDIDGVSLLDKRGYLTICISQLRDGRIYLRKHEGIRDWFNTIQCTVYDSKRRKKFWAKGQNQHFPNIYDSSHAIAEEDIGAADDEDEDSDSNNNLPKGINRLSLVSDLLMNEALTDEKQKEKQVTKSDDSGHDSGQSSLNTGCESFSENSD